MRSKIPPLFFIFSVLQYTNHMSWLTSSSHSKHTNTLVWHIDSTGISVSVISDNNVSYYNFEPINLSFADDRHRYDQLIHHTDIVARRMIVQLCASVSHLPKKALIVLGAPWAHSIRRQIVYKRKTAFKLIKSFMDDLVARDMKRLEKLHPRAEFLDPTYHDITVAGHNVPEPWGKTITDLRFSYQTGYSDAHVVSAMTAVIHETLRVPLLGINVDHYHNFLISFWKSTNLPSGLLVDTGGSVTDLALFQKKHLIQAGTLPVGLSDIRMELAQQLGMYPAECSALLSLYAQNLLQDVMMQKIDGLLIRFYREWETDFQTFCNHAVEHGDVIDQVVWAGDATDPVLSFFMRQLSSNHMQFPIVFGTATVGFMHANTLMKSLPGLSAQAGGSQFTLQHQDHIIISALIN